MFPSASEVLSEDNWRQMYKQSLEYDFPFIEKPDIKMNNDKIEIFEDGKFKTETGELGFKDILMIFDALPVDLTFVDENNKVKFLQSQRTEFSPVHRQS